MQSKFPLGAKGVFGVEAFESLVEFATRQQYFALATTAHHADINAEARYLPRMATAGMGFAHFGNIAEGEFG